MIMATWNPWQTLEALRREIGLGFDASGTHPERMFRTAFLPGRAARQDPLTNLYEDTDAVYLEALVPGVDPTTLELSIVDNTLRLTGEKRRVVGAVQPEAFHRSERATGTFVRQLHLPVEVDAQQVQATYKDGLLMVTLPKAAKAKPKQISVQVNATSVPAS